jgi:hypothetical protein
VFRFPPLTPFTKKLLIVLVATYVATLVLDRVFGLPAFELLALSPAIGLQTIWQVLTYPLAGDLSPGGVFWLIFGLLFVWVMTVPFELRYGVTTTVKLFVVAVLANAAGVLAAAFVLPTGPAFGPGVLLFALIAASAVGIPKGSVVNLFGIAAMKPWTVVWLFVGLSAIFALSAGDYGGFVGDLATVAASVLYMKSVLAPRRPKAAKPKKKKNGADRARAAGFRVIHGGGAADDDDDDERPKYLN